MSNHRPDLFEHTVRTMDYGVTPRELSDEFAELLQAVRDTGKQGTINFKLTVKPESIATGQISLTPEIKVSAPQMPRDKSMMFVTPDNNTQRDDPRQRTIEFESVEGGKQAAPSSAETPQASGFSQA